MMKNKNLKPSLLGLSVLIISIFLLIIFFNTNESYSFIESSSLWVRSIFGSLYLYFGLLCVVLLILLSISKYGNLRLGGKDRPEYSFTAWMAMLYSAGMGSGILLRAVQEPVFMQQNLEIGPSKDRSVMALEFTFYQWGFTAWAFYTLFAIIIGYYVFQKKRPVRISSVWNAPVRPLSWIHGTDFLILLTTLFGLIAALGLGTTQINGGLTHLYPTVDWNLNTTIVITILIGGLAIWSSWKGIHKGIKYWSLLNMFVTSILFIWLASQSDIKSIVVLFSESFWAYIIDFLSLSLAIPPYDPGFSFLSDWTLYYWAFWLAWAPFIGIFIARISMGRSIRQVVFGVLLIPSLTTFLWFTVFGQNAFAILSDPTQNVNQFSDVFTSIFVFFNHYSYSNIINLIIVFLLIGFLITSLDSSLYVLAMMSDDGQYNPSRKHRVIWGVLIICMGIGLLLLGDVHPDINVLTAVQKLLILTSLPLLFLSLVMSIKMIRNIKSTLDNEPIEKP